MKWTKLTSYTLKKESVKSQEENLANGGGKSQFKGISHEQVCVLVARDRTKNTFVGLLGRGRITKKQLDKAIGDKLNSSTVLCTDAWRAFKTYANDKGFTHYRFKTGAE